MPVNQTVRHAEERHGHRQRAGTVSYTHRAPSADACRRTNHHQGGLTIPARPYDAVLCDIDGVLRHWPTPGPGDLDHVHGLPAGTIAAAAFAPSRLQPAITGEITDEQWRSAVATDLVDICGSPARARSVVTAWSALMPRVDQEVVSLLTRVRDVATVALVSNATTRLESDLARQGLNTSPTPW